MTATRTPQEMSVSELLTADRETGNRLDVCRTLVKAIGYGPESTKDLLRHRREIRAELERRREDAMDNENDEIVAELMAAKEAELERRWEAETEAAIAAHDDYLSSLD